jgi:hypothetical protein
VPGGGIEVEAPDVEIGRECAFEVWECEDADACGRGLSLGTCSTWCLVPEPDGASGTFFCV